MQAGAEHTLCHRTHGFIENWRGPAVTLLRRAVACGLSPRKIADAMTILSGASRIEGVHPLQFGFARCKVRTHRRSAMPVVNPLIFYPRRAADAAVTAWRWLRLAWRYSAIMRRVMADPASATFMDHALHPAADKEAGEDELVRVFADKIPVTHGVPPRLVTGVAPTFDGVALASAAGFDPTAPRLGNLCRGLP